MPKNITFLATKPSNEKIIKKPKDSGQINCSLEMIANFTTTKQLKNAKSFL